MADSACVAFLGFGMMGEALAKPIHKVVSSLYVADPSRDFQEVSWLDRKVHTSRSNEEAIKSAQIIVLAVKPGVLSALFETHYSMFENKTVCSLVSGYSLANLISNLPPSTTVFRMMPNIAAVSGMSTTALCYVKAPPQTVEQVKFLLEQAGTVAVIPESLMDIWTAIAGCGPAYVFQFLEAIADAAVLGGLSRAVANETAISVVMGSCKVALDSKTHFAQLKDSVCSPGGVTIHAIKSLHETGFHGSGK